MFSFLFFSVGAYGGGLKKRGYKGGLKVFGPEWSNICWFRREAVGSPKRNERPLGSEIFHPEVYSGTFGVWGGAFKKKAFRGRCREWCDKCRFRGAGGVGGGMQQE